ncbi:MAG: hypothetical protein HYS12_23560 [Planctomycetes bacterium]|nr:hypothetical protein [Planctomycetota bacterium]
MDTGNYASFPIDPEDYRLLWGQWRSLLPQHAPPPEPSVTTRQEAFQALDSLLLRLEQLFGPVPLDETKEAFQGILLSKAVEDQPAGSPVSQTDTTVKPEGAKKKGRRKIDRDAMEDKAKRYLYKHRRRSKPVTLRELAQAIGCSTGYTKDLDTWRKEMDSRGARSKAGRPRVVSLTPDLEATLADENGAREAELQRLAAEQRADDASDRHPSRPRARRRV